MGKKRELLMSKFPRIFMEEKCTNARKIFKINHTCSAMFPACDRASWALPESLANTVVCIPPITAIGGTTAMVTRANCQTAVNPTINPHTNVAI